MNKLSIIVPVYNGEKTIEKSIVSLLKQTIPVDIIVVNDGSKDKTEEIILKLKENNDNIHYFHKENGGIANTRNYGVDRVETDFFGFLDADDTVREDMAEKMLKCIEENKADICLSNFTWVFEDGNTRHQKDVFYKDKHEILEKMFAVLWNKVYRTEWFRNTGLRFPEGLRYEDASLLYRLAYFMDKVCYVDETFVDYYQIQGSITHTFGININDMILVFKGIKEFYIEKGAFDEYKDEIEYLYIRFFLGNSYLRACRIIDKEVRKDTLNKGWNILMENFPDFKKNKYLKNSGMKNKYYSLMNRQMYFSNVYLFKLLYKLGIMK
ncbi:MAG: glycosyltransferase [Erysipelotrichaceae bacterium]|nr:glycosyltransferase [Erysipelotrichaceae bacterium]